MSDYTLTQTRVDDLNENLTTLLVDGVNLPIEVGAVIPESSILTFVAGTGRGFYPTGETNDNGSVPLTSTYFRYRINGYNVYISGVLSEDKKTSVLDMSFLVNGTSPLLYVDTVQVDEKTLGTNKVYLIDQDLLGQINNNRFRSGYNTTDGSYTSLDYGNYILSVLQLPFLVDPDSILDPESVQLADWTIPVEAPLLSTDKIFLDMGTISIPMVKNNMFDYVGVKAVVNLPRVDSFEIDLNYVIGQTLSIVYIIDAYTGLATINIKSTFTNNTVITLQADLGISIPNATPSILNGTILSNGDISVGGDNGILTPFVEIYSENPILADGIFTVPVLDENVLLNETGYIEVNNIDLICDATTNEKNDIISLLKGGIFIKGTE